MAKPNHQFERPQKARARQLKKQESTSAKKSRRRGSWQRVRTI